MKIKMIKNITRSGQIWLKKDGEYISPADISNDFAKALVNRGKAIEIKGKKSNRKG